MKTPERLLSLCTLSIAFCVAAVTGCSQEEKQMPPSANPPAEPVAPASTEWSWEELKNAEFEKHDAFIAQLKDMHAKFDTEVDVLRSKFKETDATDSEKKAMIELDKAEVDFEGKMKALDNVTADTWETVKSNLLSSWLNLKEAFKKARPTE
jgi:hypothetical protein